MNKILAFSITILLFGIQKVSAQNYLSYYQTINNAEIAALDKNHLLSDSLYKVAFSLVNKPFKEDYYLAALNADKLKDNTKVYNYLKLGIENGLVFKRIKKLANFTKTKQYKNLKQDYKSLRNEYLQTLNIPLRNEIVEMIRKDQRARIFILGSSRQMKKTDSYNKKRLLEIIHENGDKWPGFSTIGEITPKGKYDVTDNIALMLLHFKEEGIEPLKPYMLKAVMEGDMYPYQYARIIDYTSLKVFHEEYKANGDIKKVVPCFFYGTYKNSIICNCAKAEIERKKIGFEPIKDFYRKRNSTFRCKDEK
ncbi:MAG: hypothetical protein JW857_05455 [Bacteroidales bacterium]|nr:hypothetical protein [Bacteroidales bacterium]